MAGENVQGDESLEYPFVCCVELPTLQEMATYRVCQSICYSHTSRHDGCPQEIIWRANRGVGLRESVEGMKLARPIEKELEKNVKQIGNELHAWLCRLKFSISTNVVDDFDLSRIDIVNWCVWRPNGKIDYGKSAREVLLHGDLCVEEKFALMSAYCIEDGMKEISLNALPDSFTNEQLRVTYDMLQSYWIKYLKNELDSISVLENSSLDFTMACVCYEHNGTSIECFEYFWRRLGNENRITLAEKCLLHHSVEYTCKWDRIELLFSSLMPTMNRTLADIAGQYLTRSLISSHTCASNQLRIWRRFKNDITDEDFADMVRKVLNIASYSEYRMRVLMEIWNTACYAKKERVVPKVKMILDSFTYGYAKHHPICFDLIFRIVSMQPEADRMSLLRQHLKNLAIAIHDAQLLQKMLDLCMMDSNEQTNFKLEFGRSEKLKGVCLELLWYAKFNRLNDKLQWVFSVPDAGGVDVVQAYKKHLLFTAHSRYPHYLAHFFHSIRKWNKLSEFIGQTYVNDAESAFAMKNRIIRTRFTAIFDYTLHYHFNVVSQIVEMVFPADALLEFKRVRLVVFGERLEYLQYWEHLNNGVDKRSIQNFVEWCCDHDEKSVSQFKKSIPQMVVFEGMLTGLMRSVVVEKSTTAKKLKVFLHRGDELLRWFVGSDEKVRECKLQGIEHSVVEIKRAMEVNHDQLILEWVFGDDEVAIRRFREEKLTKWWPVKLSCLYS